MTEIKLDKNILQQVPAYRNNQWTTGTILQGTVMGRDENKLNMLLEGISFKTNIPEGFQGQKGSKLSFRIENISGNQMILKMLHGWEETAASKNQGVKQYDSLRSMLTKANIPANKENMETAKIMLNNGLSIDQTTFYAVAKMKKNVDEVVHGMTKKDTEEIQAQGYSLDKISMDMVNNFLGDIAQKSGPLNSEEETREEVENYASKYEEKSEDMEKIRKAIEALLKQGLPLTQKNIEALVAAQRKMEEIHDLDDMAIGQMISKDWSITLENLYRSQYTGGKTVGEDRGGYGSSPYDQATIAGSNTPMEEQVFDKEIERILQLGGVALIEENKRAAKLLALQHLPVNRENMEKVINIKKAVTHMDMEKLLGQAVQNMKGKQSITNIPMNAMEERIQEKRPLTEEKIDKIMEALPKIGEAAIRRVLNRQIPLNLKNLQEASIDQEMKKDIREKGSQGNQEKIMAGKRQMAEIQLKLTSEAALRLNGKGIAIDTIPLQNLVEELRGLEKENYAVQLRQAGAAATEENIQQMQEMVQKVEGLRTIPLEIIGQVMNQRISFTIEGLHGAQIQNGSVDQVATTLYETLGTQPEPRFGDTIGKIVDQIGPMLEEQGIEPSEANVRAAKILVQNQIPMTEENLNHVKMLDQKVTQMITEFHPAIAANMIKDQINPMPMHIDEVLQYMKNFEKFLGQDVSEKLSQFILEMDEQDALTSTQRDAMIGIYRMFHRIQQAEGRTVGFLLKNNMELTLNNLLEATKYLGRTNGKYNDVDVKINDQFGALQDLVTNDKSIRGQLEKIFSDIQMAMTEENINKAAQLQEEDIPLQTQNLTKMTYMQETIRQLMSNLSPQVAEKLFKELPELNNISIDRILEEMKHLKSSDSFQKANIQEQEVHQFLQGLHELENMKQSAMGLMEKYNIPFTLKNMILFKQMNEDPFFFGNKLQEVEEFLTDHGQEDFGLRNKAKNSLKELGEGKPVEEVMEEIKDSMEDIKHDSIGFSSSEKHWIWDRTTDLEKMADIQKQIHKEEQVYQIPIQLHDGLSHMNLYVMKDGRNKTNLEKDAFRAFISLKTENMGTIQAYMKVQGQQVDLAINGENQEDTQYLQSNGEGLRKAMESIGYTINKLQYGIDNPKNPLSEEIHMEDTGFHKRKISMDGFEMTI